MALRLLLVTNDWPPPGATARRNAESLQAVGLNVEVFAFRGRDLYNWVVAWTRLRPRLHPKSYDVVHTQDGAALLTFPKRVPLVITVTRLRFGVRFLARRADAIVVGSEELGKQLRNSRVHVLPPQLDEAARAARLVDVYHTVARA